MAVAPSWFRHLLRITRRVKKPPLLHQKINRSWDNPTAGGYGDATGAPRKDFQPVRLGADPPMAMVTLRAHVESTVLACFGVGAPLGPAGVTDGTAQREAARRLWTLTIQPLAGRIAEELTRVLDAAVSLDFGRPSGMADLAARARAVGGLTKAGVSLDDALLLAGWADD